MLIAEDLLLLLTDDASGKLLAPGEQVDLALGGALLVELSLAEQVTVDDRGRLQVPGRADRTGDPLLGDALTVIGTRVGKKPKSAVGPLSKKLRPALYERLAGAGLLRAEHARLLGLLPTTRWPAQDVDHENAVRDALTQVLVVGTTPAPRTAALVGLLQALHATHKVVVPREHGLSRHDLDRRAKDVAQGDWCSTAVRQAVDAVNAAVIAAVASSGAASG